MPSRTFINPATGEEIVDPPIRPFTEVLKELSEGATLSELSEALWDLIQRVEDTGRSGSLALTVKVARDGQGRVLMTDAVSLKLPEHRRAGTRFFISGAGNASRRDPNQPELPNVAQLGERHA